MSDATIAALVVGNPGSEGIRWSVAPADPAAFISGAEARVEQNAARAEMLLATANIYGQYGNKYLAGIDIEQHSLTGELPALGSGYRGPLYHQYARPEIKESLVSVGSALLEDVAADSARLERPESFASREEYLISLDRYKNSCLTLFHAVQFAGRNRMLSGNETETVDRLFGLATSATRGFYLGILGHGDDEVTAELARGALDSASLDPEQRDYIASVPRHCFEIQELDQPYNILRSSVLAATEFPSTEHIIGLSAGGTQYAIATHLMLELTGNGRRVELGAVPVSTHTDETQKLTGKVSPWIEDQLRGFDLSSKQVLICDDSSNSGRTLGLAAEVVSAYQPSELHISLAELDTVRARLKAIKQAGQLITNFAHPDLRAAIGSVPVSMGENPDVQLRRLPAISGQDTLDGIQLPDIDVVSDDAPERFLALFAQTEADLEERYGQRSIRSLASAVLRELGVAPSESDELRPLLVHTMRSYPFIGLPEVQRHTSEVPKNWMREGTLEFIADVGAALKDGRINEVVLFGIGDSGRELSPPWEGSNELEWRSRMSGLTDVLESAGLLGHPAFSTLFNPREYALTRFALPNLNSGSQGAITVFSNSTENRGLVADAAAGLSREARFIDGEGSLAPALTLGHEPTSLLIDLDVLLDDAYRRFYQPRNAYALLKSLGVVN